MTLRCAAMHNLGMAKKRKKLPIYFREWRLFRGLSQEKAAERIGVTQGQLSKFENGKDNFTPATLEAMAFAYSCEPGDLFRPPDPPRSDLEAFLMGLSGKQRDKALKILKAAITDDKDEEAA